MLPVFGGLLVLIVAGITARLIPGFPDPVVVRKVIGKIVITFFLPALIFNAVFTAPITQDFLAVPAVAIGVALFSLTLSVLVYGIIFKHQLTGPVKGTLILAGTWCNATYLGLPIVTSVLGQSMQKVPIIFDLLGMTLTLFTLGTIVAVEYGRNVVHHTIWQGLLEVVRLPPVISLVLALSFNMLSIAIPQWFLDTCRMGGGAVIPLMLFSVGLALPFSRESISRQRWTDPILIPAIIIKLIIAPTIGYYLISILISDPHVAKATLLESAMPTMVLTMVFAERYGLDEEVLARMIVITTVLSMGVLLTIV
ncbi:MAG: AEC family transporter [Ignavibacteria bacterium]|nr:AEC family transporter [Ignavibacteria bacterium]